MLILKVISNDIEITTHIFFVFCLDERRRSQGNSYNDSNQLFLGNLPHIATEDALREIFEEFGTIMDLRILSKPANKGAMGARMPPNYGFITYETQQAVQTCLDAKVCFHYKIDACNLLFLFLLNLTIHSTFAASNMKLNF